MSNISPFKAFYYNEKKVKDLAKVVCPPYDVISEEQQTELLNLSPYNFTHISFNKDMPGDNKEKNKYKRARVTFEEWISKHILVQDEKPGLYFYKQEYKIMGQRHTRLGFIGLMELQDEEDSTVFPHENTHAHAVDDRLMLWDTLNSNLSCIFVCFSDKQRKVEKIFNKHVFVEKALIDVEDKDKVRHKVWKLTDEALIKEVQGSVVNQQLFIADGHHRYKVAMNLRKIRKEQQKETTGKEPWNYVMTYFTNLDSKDLQIFPMHRIVKTFSCDLDALEESFRIDKVSGKQELSILLAKAGKNEHAFGLYTKGKIYLLRLKNKMMIDEFIKKGSSDFKSLDATILKYFVFDRVGIASSEIIYTKDLNEATDMVDNGQAEASFIMNPVKISQLKSIALNGERMPPKTTYFYPKVLSGLTVHKMD